MHECIMHFNSFIRAFVALTVTEQDLFLFLIARHQYGCKVIFSVEQ